MLFASMLPLSTAAGTGVPTELLQHLQQAIESGRIDEARTETQAGLKAYPSSAALRNIAGIIEAQSGNYVSAETSFRKAIELEPDLTSAYLNLGRLYQENAAKDKQAVSKASSLYVDLLRREPGNTEARYQGAYTMMLDHSYRSARVLLDGLPADFQSRAQVLAVRCAIEAGSGAIDRAAELLRQLVRSPELTGEDVSTVQPVLLKKKYRKLELSLLEGLDARHLATPASLERLAELYEDQQRFPDARATLEKSAASGSVTVSLLTRLAQIAWKQKDWKGALGYLAHARELDSANAGVHFFFGMVCVEMDLPIEAEKSLKQAVSLAPENAWYNYALGAVTVQTKKWDAAIPYFQKYTQLKPDDPRGRLALAIARVESDQEDSAQAELQKLTAYPTTSATAHLYLGKLAFRQDKFATAETEFKYSLNANPGNAETWAELATTYIRQQRYPLAQDAVSRSLRIEPSGIRGNMALLALYKQTADGRVKEQATRVQQLAKEREANAKALLRTVEVRPFYLLRTGASLRSACFEVR